ncbi:MAG: alpha-mannosidase [Planctomycetota bacterium]|nr:MAG: alpha-mannosidase [Planctomycetota bacterium]
MRELFVIKKVNVMKKLMFVLLVSLIASVVLGAVGQKPDMTKDKILYTIGYAHLDTQWRWDYQTTIDSFIKNTLDDNFDRFEKYPGYVFNFTGAVRYEMMKEYYPEKYEKLKEYIRQGRWFVAGSSVDEGEVIISSPESIIRQILYGNGYFRKEFGKESVDCLLPDDFGYPASLPSILAHCGLKGFSTQKLHPNWGSAVGIPFKIGVWEGPDGSSVIAALDPGCYGDAYKGRLDKCEYWINRVNENGKKYGVFADYHYYGVGDVGGAPRDKDVKNYVSCVDNPDSQIRVYLTSSDQMYKDITPKQKRQLPKYKGDLLLKEHSAGSLSSQAYMKRCNRKNEQLADSAERAAVTAQWLGAADYPQEKLTRSWIRVLANQMHDILPGTSIPRAYNYAYNDEFIALNGFAASLENSVGAVSSILDTNTKGKAIVVYNPLATEREDIVEAEVKFTEGTPRAVKVFNPDGGEVASQIISRSKDSIKILFIAKVPSVGFAIYDVQPASSICKMQTGLSIKGRTLENNYYKVVINRYGDIASIFDKKAVRELLAGTARLEFLSESPRNYPAWNMEWKDRQNPPIGYVDGQATIKIVEKGPVRVALEVVRKSRGSIFKQQIRLSGGDAGRRVEVKNHIDWQTTGVSLKAAFPLTVSNANATYNWGLSTIERGNNCPVKYEVPSHEWFDLTDSNGSYGVTILEDCKFGSDKPSDNIVRLTLLYTPDTSKAKPYYQEQRYQDWGYHDFIYGIYGHKGDWRKGSSEWQGRRLNQPLVAFQTPSHSGQLGKKFSFLSVNTHQVDVRAVKKAENSKYTIIRLQELWGQDAKEVIITGPAPIVSAYEVDGQERQIAPALIKDGKLVLDMSKYSPRSFAVKFERASVEVADLCFKMVDLAYNEDVVSTNKNKADGKFDKDGRTIPAELLPSYIISEGIRFKIGDTSDGKNNVLACRGQTIELPQGDYNRIYLLASATEDTSGVFKVGDSECELGVQCWTGYIGQYDTRVWDKKFGEIDHTWDGKLTGLEVGYIKRDNLAWFGGHRNNADGSFEAYHYSYIFKYALDMPAGTAKLTLPDNGAIKIFAVTVAKNENDSVRAAQPLYDDFTGRKPLLLRVFVDAVVIKNNPLFSKELCNRGDRI